MLVENSESAPAPSQSLHRKKKVPWLRLFLSLILSGLGLWFVTRDASLTEIFAALGRARLEFVLLGLLVIALTTVVKAWRWRLLFRPRADRPPFGDIFWALSLGQLVNTAVPVLRLGEVARVYDLGQQTNSNKAHALGTLVVEKVLDLIMLAATLFLLLPFLVLPGFVRESGTLLAFVALVTFLGLLLLAAKTQFALELVQLLARTLPARLEERLLTIADAGLKGLATLRSGRATFSLLLTSLFIAILAVMTPWILFFSMGIPLGLLAAATIHVVLTVGTLPPSTPAKVGVFEFLVAFMLQFFGVEGGATILAYTILYHLVVVLPQIAFGGIAAARGSRDARDG